MTKIEYLEKLQTCMDDIKKLPPSEMEYYLLLLINSIKPHCTQMTEDFSGELHNFITLMHQFQANVANEAQVKETLKKLEQSYQKLYDISKLSCLSTQIGYALLNIAGAILAFFTGIIGGLIGGTVGFCRSIITLSNPLSYTGVGFVTGLFFGAAIGFRIPKKLFKNELSRQIKFCLDKIVICTQEIEKQHQTAFEATKDAVIANLLNEYFDGDKVAFDVFLKSSDHSFDICTLDARFISPTLEGYVGQHSFIKVSVNKDKPPALIELSPSPSDITREHKQTEPRDNVSGGTIVDMLALHEILKQTHTGSIKYALTIMKPGENDCFTYIDKILLGTQQETAGVCRFSGKESWACRKIIRFFVTKLSPFKEEVIKEAKRELAAMAG